jgi:hypothetical protein
MGSSAASGLAKGVCNSPEAMVTMPGDYYKYS